MLKIMYINADGLVGNGNETEIKDKVEEIRLDIGRVETKLSENVKLYIFFPKRCTITRKEREDKGGEGPVLLVSHTMRFQEVLVDSGPFNSIF